MYKIITKIYLIAIMLFVFQLTLTAQPIGSKIKVGTDSHISYWNGSTWELVQPGMPGQSLQFVPGNNPSWINNPNGITTNQILSITNSSAIIGGTVVSDGGATITAKGMCWSINPNPTITDIHTNAGYGIGSFQNNLTGLSPGTVYYVRSYAINSNNIAYGNEISFATQVMDYDGNTYDAIVIGAQVWMKQNLKTTHYTNGNAIDNPLTDIAWINSNTGAYTWYNNDEATHKNTYGALYNWITVNTGNLCPTGWHVPTNAEWTALENYLGSGDVGGKLKEIGLTHWNTPNTGATNETGFTALPGGCRYEDGTYLDKGFYGYYWSSTESDLTQAWRRCPANNISGIYTGTNNKNMGLSVRCLKN